MERTSLLASAAIMLTLLCEPGAHAQDADEIPSLPTAWRQYHDVRISVGRCDGLLWIQEFRALLSEVSATDDEKVAGVSFWSFSDGAPPLELDATSSFPSLRCLTVFDGRRLAKSWWQDVAQLKELRALVVPTARLDDDGLRTLQSLESLQILDISMTQITDASIDVLASFDNLRLLNVSGTRMTLYGGEKLRAKMPNCAVVFERWIYGERGGSNWSKEALQLETSTGGTTCPGGDIPEAVD